MKKNIWALIWQVPLVGAVITCWDTFVQQHPAYAAIIAFLYELLCFVFVFGGKVWKKLEKEAVEAVAERLKVAFLNFFSRFRRRYNKQVIYDHRVFNVRGLKTKGTFTLEVEKVFVELRIAPGRPAQAIVNPTTFRNVKGSMSIWDFLRQMKGQEAVALAVIGPPGSGKTTLLQHIALILASNKQRLHGIRAYTPIFFFLREHASFIENESPNIAELAKSHFSDSRRFPGLKLPPKWFERQLAKGKYIVLLDGLDEVVDKKRRKTVSEWVDSQIRAFPRCLFVVTSRPGGYRDASLSRAHVLEVMPFNREQTARFVHNWYLANKIASYNKDDAGVRQDAERQAKDLLYRLREAPILYALTVNPLLLTMVTTVHDNRGTLPGRRVELYSEICDVLLGHWQKAKGIPDSLTAAQKRTVLEPLAVYMMGCASTPAKRTVSTSEALEVITPHLEEVGMVESQIPSFLEDLQNFSGLFLEKETGIWSFAHMAFQEYLCACHWQTTGEPASWDGDRWKSLISDSWWHETLRLYGSMGDATALVRTCLDLNTIQSLTLVADVSEDALRLQKSERDNIKNRLEQDLESEDPERADLAAKVLLNQRLTRGFHSLDDYRDIDTTPITCAEYQLFIESMRNRGKFHQPDHWFSFHFPEGQAKKSIVGLRFEDVHAFCQWLTENTGQTYRLPTEEELVSFLDDREQSIGFWTQNRKLEGLLPEAKINIKKELTKDIDLPPPLSFALATKLNLSSKLYHAFSRAISFSLVYDRSLYHALKRKLGRDLPRFLNLALYLDLTLFRLPTRLIAFFHAFDRSCDFEKGILFNNTFDNKLIDLILNRKLTYDREFPRTIAISLIQALDRAKIIDLIQERALDLKIKDKLKLTVFTELYNAIERSDFNESLGLIKEILSMPLLSGGEDCVNLISDLINAAAANTFVTWRKAYRSFALRSLKLIYKGFFLMGKEKKSKWWMFSLFNLKKREGLEEDILRLFWFLRAVQTREDRKLKAWEGILLVREIEHP